MDDAKLVRRAGEVAYNVARQAAESYITSHLPDDYPWSPHELGAMVTAAVNLAGERFREDAQTRFRRGIPSFRDGVFTFESKA